MVKKFSLVLIVIISAVLCVSCSNKGPQGPAGKNGLACYTLQNNPAYNGTSDTYIDSSGTSLNHGSETYMYAGVLNGSGNTLVARALIRFDLTTIVPSDVKVDSAYLTLYPYSPSMNGTTTMTAYAIDGVTADKWSENIVTWDWFNTPGGDFSPKPMSDTLVLSSADIPVSVTFKLTAAVVQGWISDPTTNNGLILKASNETQGYNYFAFLTKDNVSQSANPILTVYYSLP